MLKWLFFKREQTAMDDPRAAEDDGALVELNGRKVQRKVKPVVGLSILELAERNKVDWLSNCKRGTCARCRCFVIEGKQFLSEPNSAELGRLEEEEIDQGFRLACQAKIVSNGKIVVRHAPYF